MHLTCTQYRLRSQLKTKDFQILRKKVFVIPAHGSSQSNSSERDFNLAKSRVKFEQKFNGETLTVRNGMCNYGAQPKYQPDFIDFFYNSGLWLHYDVEG